MYISHFINLLSLFQHYVSSVLYQPSAFDTVYEFILCILTLSKGFSCIGASEFHVTHTMHHDKQSLSNMLDNYTIFCIYKTRVAFHQTLTYRNACLNIGISWSSRCAIKWYFSLEMLYIQCTLIVHSQQVEKKIYIVKTTQQMS